MKKNRSQKKKATQQAILETARFLFIEKGFDETTTRAIAEQAGVATGTVFVHFPDKRSILAAILYEEVEQTLHEAFQHLPTEKGIQDKIFFLVKALLENYAKQPQLSTRLIKELLFMSGLWGERFEEQVFLFLQKLAALFEEEKQQGRLRKELDSMLAAHSIWAHYQFILFIAQHTEFKDIESQLQLFRTLVKQNFQGFL